MQLRLDSLSPFSTFGVTHNEYQLPLNKRYTPLERYINNHAVYFYYELNCLNSWVSWSHGTAPAMLPFQGAKIILPQNWRKCRCSLYRCVMCVVWHRYYFTYVVIYWPCTLVMLCLFVYWNHKWHIYYIRLFVYSLLTYRTCLQPKYRLYEIRPQIC